MSLRKPEIQIISHPFLWREWETRNILKQQETYMTKSPFSNNPFIASSEQPSRGFFDIRFTRFITNVLVPVIWCFVLITSFLDYGYGIMTALGIMPPILAVEVLLFTPTRFILSILSIEHPVVAILASTILLFLNLVVTRIVLELIIVLFRIETHLRAMREKSEQ